MFDPLRLWRLLRLQLRWRKARRRGRTLRLKIGNVAGFLQALEECGVVYVVLRWFEEVPLRAADEVDFHEDIDLLIDQTRLPEVIQLASRHPGQVRCDFYSPSGKRGTGFKKMPYYPPVTGQEILQRRTRYADAFHVPAPADHFRSLAYHIVYHKGLGSGVASGVDEFPGTSPAKRRYGELLESLGETTGVNLTRPYTLIALHDYLSSCAWSMPYDLMLRWPVEKDWIGYLARREEDRYRELADLLPNLVVFLIRADATGDDRIEAATRELIAGHFRILRDVRLDEAALARVVRSTRGGNWEEHGGTEFVPPVLALICNDAAPVPFSDDDVRRARYPLISNANVLLKNDIRDAINRRFPADGHDRIVLHASDTALEAQHHLQAVYGSEYTAVGAALVREIEADYSGGIL